MAMILGGHLVGKYLKEVEKVDTVFCLSGGHIEAILDSFTEYKIRTIDVRHEQAAAMMAEAWSIYSGKPGVCLVTAGPGFHQCLNRHCKCLPGQCATGRAVRQAPLEGRPERRPAGDKPDGHGQAHHQMGSDLL